MMTREDRLDQLIAAAEASIRTRVGQIEAAIKHFDAGSYYRIEKAADDLKLTANQLQNALKSRLRPLNCSQEHTKAGAVDQGSHPDEADPSVTKDCTAPAPLSAIVRGYADLVLGAYDDQEHGAKREMLDRKAETQIKARQRL